ncbi:MAG: hypothetical protein C4293_07565 [Nitrospiraceae bacterium]
MDTHFKAKSIRAGFPGGEASLLATLCLWIEDLLLDRGLNYGSDPTGRLSFSQEDLDTKTLFENLPKFSSAVSLRPDYDLASLQWLLEMAEQKKQWGALRKEALRNAAREIVGWYLYYLKSGGMSRVIQIAASPKSVSHVLDHLFYSAWRQGATAISGRLEPKYLHELSHQYCRFTETCSAFLVQSHSQDILQAVYTGDAFLSRLEGEWWNRFGELVQ